MFTLRTIKWEASGYMHDKTEKANFTQMKLFYKISATFYGRLFKKKSFDNTLKDWIGLTD